MGLPCGMKAWHESGLDCRRVVRTAGRVARGQPVPSPADPRAPRAWLAPVRLSHECRPGTSFVRERRHLADSERPRLGDGLGHSRRRVLPGCNSPAPRQRQKVGVQRTTLARVQHDAPHRGLFFLERIAKRPDACRSRTGHRAAGLDFQRDEIPTLFEDEIHFVTGAVAPEMELAPERVRRAPGLQRLEQGLFQPEAGVGTGLGLRRCLDGGQGRRMGVVEYRSGRETNHFHAVECNRSSQFAAR